MNEVRVKLCVCIWFMFDLVIFCGLFIYYVYIFSHIYIYIHLFVICMCIYICILNLCLMVFIMIRFPTSYVSYIFEFDGKFGPWTWWKAGGEKLPVPKKKTKVQMGVFQKKWYPQIIHFNRVFHYKPSILVFPPYFWKHPHGAGKWQKNRLLEKDISTRFFCTSPWSLTAKGPFQVTFKPNRKPDRLPFPPWLSGVSTRC